jgi:lipopolysaccharide/colanic/teichoic acid biosynthesis glycosyltransferase
VKLALTSESIRITAITTKQSFYFIVKQVFETVVSIIALLFLIPCILLIGVLIKIDSPGPVLFVQERVGKNRKSFKLVKFRTMVIDAEAEGPKWAEKNDSRVTRVGHYLRKYHLDEIPQLFNVIKGDMAIIGPRPERSVFIEEFEKTIPHFGLRLQVKPGITGWAQIHGGYELNPQEKLHLDLYYIEKSSALLDAEIMIKSVPVVFFAKGWR